MSSMELVLHPDDLNQLPEFSTYSLNIRSNDTAVLSGIRDLPESLFNLYRQLLDRFSMSISSYHTPYDRTGSSKQLQLYFFSSYDQFADGAFIRHCTHVMQHAKNSGNIRLALLNFRLPRCCPSAVAFFDDLLFTQDDPTDCVCQIEGYSRRSGIGSFAINLQAARAFFELSFVGRSDAYQLVVENVCRMATCEVPVLIEGETGTGKEALARAVHYLGDRSKAGFIPINCAAIPDTLFESELFGHERGAFTNAQQKRSGLVDLAEGGTLFLDEVDSLSDKAQSSLLRFLQTGEYRPVGSNAFRRAKLRIVSATNTPLKTAVEQGKFRHDLLYRLTVLKLEVPPLRERTEDIDVIAEHLLQRFERVYQRGQKVLHPDTLDWLRGQPWPGNVRELENVLLRKYLLGKSAIIVLNDEEHATSTTKTTTTTCEPGAAIESLTRLEFQEAKQQVIDQFTAQYLRAMLSRTRGNISLAARLSGKERRAFGKLVKRYHVDAARFCVD